jgi:hypothetical protein
MDCQPNSNQTVNTFSFHYCNYLQEKSSVFNLKVSDGTVRIIPSHLSYWEIVSDAFSETGATSAKGFRLRLKYNYFEPHKLECCCMEGGHQKFMALKDLSKHILEKHCARNRMCLLCESGKSGKLPIYKINEHYQFCAHPFLGCNLSFRNVKLASKHVTFQHNLSLMMYYMCDGCQLLLPGVQALKYHLVRHELFSFLVLRVCFMFSSFSRFTTIQKILSLTPS